jgi:hypothetical protein
MPEQQLGVLGDVRGLDVVELGCGTAYFCVWLARRGARLTGGRAIATRRQGDQGQGRRRTRVTARAVAGALVLCGYLAGLGYSDALPVDGGHGVERPGGNSPDFLILQRQSASALALLRKRFGPAAHAYQVDG